jgi:5-methylcytosine-specific restriction endonuclease McrA
VVNWQRAIVMDLLDRADVLEYYDCAVSSVSATFALPAVVRSRWRSSGAARAGGAGVPLNRRNIMTRDRNRCCYCGVEAAHAREPLTLDHIVPTSRGGENSWTNLVTCCMPCNQRKGDKLLKQLPGWRLRTQPREPSPWELDLVLAAIGAGDARSTPEEWQGYLPAAKARPGEAWTDVETPPCAPSRTPPPLLPGPNFCPRPPSPRRRV